MGIKVNKRVKRSQTLTKSPTKNGYLAFSRKEWENTSSDIKKMFRNITILKETKKILRTFQFQMD